MKTFKYFILLVIFFTIQLRTNSQIIPIEQRLYIETNYNYGFVTPHHDYMAYFINDHVKGFQLEVGAYTCGNKDWHLHYNYPRLGAGFYHSGLGNNIVYGKMNALYFYTDRLFFNINRKFNIGNKICFGLAYVTKRFDLYENNFNLAISSNINAFIRYDLAISARISSLIKVKIGVGLTHTSNGNIREPNKGLNIISSFIDFQYSLTDQRINIVHQSSESEIKSTHHQFLVAGGLGQKSVTRMDSRTYLVYALSGEYEYRISHSNWLGAAITGYLDNSIKQELKDIDKDYHQADNLRLTMNLSYEIKMGKLSYVFQPGIYLKNSFTKVGNISNRMGLRYYFKSGLMTGIMIKAHWVAIADVIEWSVGYKMHK